MCVCSESVIYNACPDIIGGLPPGYGVPNLLFVGFPLRKTLQKLLRNEYFGGKRNIVNGTLRTDTIYGNC